MGKGINDGMDAIYIDLRQSKYANPPGNLEDRWTINFAQTILGVHGALSLDGDENWQLFVHRAIEKDPAIPYSGNCYLNVNEI
jgi:hypothetical protein